MRRIGLIDHYLDEFHAYNAFKTVDLANKKLGYDYAIVGAYAECDKAGGVSSDAFCEKFSIKRYGSIGELAEAVDALIILAPDNSERKEALAFEAIPYRKPIFMDKTFTNSYASAVRIFDEADKFGTPLFSSSSLRYSAELAPFKGDSTSVLVFGSGVTMEDYAVHYLEIVISLMGVGVKKVAFETRGIQEWVELTYADGRRATMAISMEGYLGFHVFLADRDGSTKNITIASDFFALQMEEILGFFSGKGTSFDRKETLELMRVYDAIFEVKENSNKCVTL